MATFHEITNTEVDSSGVNEIGFNDIADTYDHLYIVASLRTNTTDSALWDDVFLRFNERAASEYTYSNIEVSNTSPLASRGGGAAGVRVGRATNPAASAGYFNTFEIWVPNYASDAGFKPIICTNHVVGTIAATTYWRILITQGQWQGTPAAITDLEINLAHGSDLFVQHSNATLYGVTGV
jgi:hypothetical protein